jgi:hypothetical protein
MVKFLAGVRGWTDTILLAGLEKGTGRPRIHAM